MMSLPMKRMRFVVLASAVASSLVAPLGVCVSAPSATAVPAGDTRAASKGLGGLVIFDATATNATSATLVPVGRAPAHVIVDSRGEGAYLSTAEDDGISVVVAARDVVVSRVFIANTLADTVSTIDVATQRVIGTVPVGAGPGGITYRPTSR